MASRSPISDDSIYTERYMSTPELNPSGYANASVSRMAGFKHADFALAHGCVPLFLNASIAICVPLLTCLDLIARRSGDDNVHYQNTANLLDRFTIAQVR